MAINRVCSGCIGDLDLKKWIRRQGGGRGCDACGMHDYVTCSISALCAHMTMSIRQHWAAADDNLGYCTAEGGYLGAATYDTYDLLVDEIGLDLPRDVGRRLLLEIIDHLSDNVWCKIDPYRLDVDEIMSMSWRGFCHAIKYKRRFFFNYLNDDGDEHYSPASLLNAVAQYADRLDLITSIEVGQSFYRVGLDPKAGSVPTAGDFGPPPAALALQSNRMNPPGIPMMYLASDPETARLEARRPSAFVGDWKAHIPLRMLDLRNIPPAPGFFSKMSRYDRLQLNFLREFRDSIVQPVERTERINIDYLPSQVATEYFRDYEFSGGKVCGILYGSTLCAGWNSVVFADRELLGLDLADESGAPKSLPWLVFEGALYPVDEVETAR